MNPITRILTRSQSVLIVLIVLVVVVLICGIIDLSPQPARLLITLVIAFASVYVLLRTLRGVW